MRLEDLKGKATISIPEAGSLLGLSQSGSYVAADKGDIPTLRFGRLRRVPVGALLSCLGFSPNAEAAPVGAAPRTSTTSPELTPAKGFPRKDSHESTRTL